MLWASLLALAAVVQALPSGELEQRQGGVTMLRFGCAQVVIDRLDPLVNPGSIPSPHVHQIVGGNGFNASMTTGDVSNTASCTTCAFSEDFSNYWTANLYFKARNGTYKRVPQLGAARQFNDDYSTKIGGGILVYYVSAQPGKITAFKPGFRMLVGDPTSRSRKDSTLKRQNCFRCYTGPNFGGDVSAPCQDAKIDTEALPTGPCKGGIRSNILFPTCWDGKNLDSPNHQDHIAYPTTGPATFLSLGGSCPSTHPVRIPQLMYEVVWDTTAFNNKAEWPADGSQPFYFSYGDNTGYGQHADYVFGWKGDSLQKAMDTSNCMGAKCGTLKTQAIDAGKKCSVNRVVQEDHDGWIKELPGINMGNMGNMQQA
ncbi:hypothetical protein JX265_003080 [Neoarthrinium moseri]|uniref:DUF1996 domain-containing protein n=1 Tax=Neoarthrinium moseri TaxID=1658444 RepID=A0A9Q0APX0_9PEZI|nr:uncharacterized protein JN550_005992 [Neoarthrinium moseri]KAI1852598.1 hypothetical protein JX266_002139 [Neoarthrinium moseri]KAI1869005.1 hypothetical protein JN550_005992 [Neoarthrinium moseri]KAI1878903.1 hypothetical protein JX265_003080 [Neoarthrinium moseri]